MSTSQEVVVTGIGVVTPVGIGIHEFWQALLDGRNGVRIQEAFRNTDLPFRIGASIDDFDGRKYIKPRKALKVMCRPIQFGCAAAAQAASDAGLTEYAVEPDRVGTVFGTEAFYADPSEVSDVFHRCVVDQSYLHDRWGEFAMREIQPLWMLKYLPNMVASHISIAMDARGPSNSICQAEASSALSIIEGATMISRGAADIVIAGGTGSRLMLTSMLHRGSAQLSQRIHEPEKACRPFDANRDGLVAGEGAGAVILENKTHALERGARIYAELSGFARSYLPFKDDQFSLAIGKNLAQAVDSCDARASLQHVNAHANSTRYTDRVEAQAIEREFGNVPVVANKSIIGNLGPAGSAVETAATVLAVHHGILPGSLNYETPDPDCPVNLITETTQLNGEFAVKNSISFTGQIVSLVFKKHAEP